MNRLVAPLICAAALAACGQEAPAGAAWRSSHPDPRGYGFLEQAQLGGVCAISVRYPDDAPSAINADGSLYLQRGRSARGTGPGPAVTVVGRSGDWTLVRDPGALVLLTRTDRFTYTATASC